MVITTVFSETKSIVNRNSKLAGPSKKCIQMDELAQQDHTYRLSEEEWYLTLIQSGKKCDFDQIFELQSLSKTVFIVNQVKKLQNKYLHNNTGDGTLSQAILGGTRPKVGGAHDFFFFSRGHFIFLFRLQSKAIHCNRRGVHTDSPHTSLFSCTVRMLNDVYQTALAQVSARTRHLIPKPSTMSG